MRWYVASLASFQKKVRPIEIDRFTDSSVWVGGRRRSRKSDWDSYFPSAEEAYKDTERRMEIKIEWAKREIQHWRSELGKLQSEKSDLLAQ